MLKTKKSEQGDLNYLLKHDKRRRLSWNEGV